MINFNQEKYSRLKLLPGIGQKGQNAIFNSRVGIFGIGGLGSWSSLLLAQMGVGYLRIVDRDVVEVSNLSRTPIYTFQSIDLPKAEEAAKFLQKINPDLIIDQKVINIDEASAEDLVKDLDIVIDGLDNISARLALNKVCKKLQKPYVFAGAIATSGNMSTFCYNEDDPCLNCIFGLISDDEMEKCDVVGVHTAILSLIASMQVNEAIKIITKKKPIFDSILAFIHLDSMEIEKIQFKQNPQCEVCFPSSKTVEKSKTKIVELCGDRTFLVTQNKKEMANLDLIAQKIEQSPNTLIKKGSLGLTLKLHKEDDEDNDVFVSIFANGNILIRGESDSQSAQKVFDLVKKNFFIVNQN